MVNCYSHSCLFNNINFNGRFIMEQISNTIEVEYEHFLLQVDYDWRKGNAGDYYNSPEPNETDIIKVNLIGYINNDGSVEGMNVDYTDRINYKCPYLPINIEEKIIEEIEYDVESLM